MINFVLEQNVPIDPGIENAILRSRLKCSNHSPCIFIVTHSFTHILHAYTRTYVTSFYTLSVIKFQIFTDFLLMREHVRRTMSPSQCKCPGFVIFCQSENASLWLVNFIFWWPLTISSRFYFWHLLIKQSSVNDWVSESSNHSLFPQWTVWTVALNVAHLWLIPINFERILFMNQRKSYLKDYHWKQFLTFGVFLLFYYLWYKLRCTRFLTISVYIY